MNKRIVLILLLLVVAVAAAATWFMRAKPVRVAVVEVQRGDVRSTVSNTRAGTVDACRRAGISPTMGGQLAKLPVAKGDAVVARQMLLELWNVDLRAELLLARRDAVAARARADEACVRAEVSQRDAERLESLRGRGLSSEEETDRALGNAKAKAAACKAGRETARVSDAQVEVAQANLERTILRAPFDGVIAEINGELGEFVTPSPVGIPTPPTVDLIDDCCLYISAPIDEVDAPAVRAGQQAVITMDAFRHRNFRGWYGAWRPMCWTRKSRRARWRSRRRFANVETPICCLVTAPTSKCCWPRGKTCCASPARHSSRASGLSCWPTACSKSARSDAAWRTGNSRRSSMACKKANWSCCRSTATGSSRAPLPSGNAGVIELRELCRNFQVGDQVVHALDHVEPVHRRGRIRVHHGAVGFRQIHPAEHSRPAGHARPRAATCSMTSTRLP